LKFKTLVAAIFITLSQSTLASKITVSTFNINALVPLLETSRVERICDEIKRSQSDVIFLQEVWVREYREILKDCNFPYSLDIDTGVGLYKRVESGSIGSTVLRTISSLLSVFISPGLGYDSGLMILSKFPFEQNQVYSKLEFQVNGNEDSFWDGEIAVMKGAVGVVINIRGKKVFLATTHLVANYGKEKYTKQRIDQLKQLKLWIKEHSRGLPSIVGGDFNFATRGSIQLKIWQEIREKVWPKSVYTEVQDKFLQDTHPEGVLDRIFGVNGATPLTGSLVFNKNADSLSDHLGFQTTFKITK